MRACTDVWVCVLYEILFFFQDYKHISHILLQTVVQGNFLFFFPVMILLINICFCLIFFWVWFGCSMIGVKRGDIRRFSLNHFESRSCNFLPYLPMSSSLIALSLSLSFPLFYIYSFLRGRERETHNLKQAPGSELSAQSPMRGLNSQTAKSDAQPTEPPRSPPSSFF